jgi:hypothetical protein
MGSPLPDRPRQRGIYENTGTGSSAPRTSSGITFEICPGSPLMIVARGLAATPSQGDRDAIAVEQEDATRRIDRPLDPSPPPNRKTRARTPQMPRSLISV